MNPLNLRLILLALNQVPIAPDEEALDAAPRSLFYNPKKPRQAFSGGALRRRWKSLKGPCQLWVPYEGV